MLFSVKAAYRIGMLAMETLTRRVHDDRPPVKYSRTPPCGEDVKWLLGIALKLGQCQLIIIIIRPVSRVTPSLESSRVLL